MSFSKFLIYLLLAFLLIRFSAYIFSFAIKFWYISIPVIIYLLIRSRKKSLKKKNDNDIIDADFTVIEDDEDDEDDEEDKD